MAIAPEGSALTERDQADLQEVIAKIDEKLNSREHQVALGRGDVVITIYPGWEPKEKLLQAVAETYTKLGWYRVTSPSPYHPGCGWALLFETKERAAEKDMVNAPKAIGAFFWVIGPALVVFLWWLFIGFRTD
ncbi:MAG: hypothetical protein AAB490_03785 [Patescibacteria group bacterium]